jgi:nicotinamidase-related amidase
MTTLENRPNEALLVIDVQKDVMGASINSDAVVERIDGLVAAARGGGVPVVWVQHSDPRGMPKGSPGWEIVDELTVAGGEPVVHKVHGDSFEGTELEQVLEGLGVGALVVCGAQSDACIRSTIHGAFARGYDVTLVSDAHTTEDLSEWGAPTPELVISHTNLYWTFVSGPGKTADVKAADEVVFA